MTITPEYQAMEDLREKTNYFWSTLGWEHIWIGIMLRRYHTAHPDGLIRWRTIKRWAKIAEWQMQPGEWKPEDLEGPMRGFLTVGRNRPGSDNRWSITSRSTSLRHSSMAEYSIGRVRSFEEDMDADRVWLERSLEEGEADWLTLAKGARRRDGTEAHPDEARGLANAAASHRAVTDVRAGVYRHSMGAPSPKTEAESAECPLGTDPAEWGLKPGAVTADFVLRAMEELKTLTGDAWNARYQMLQKIANDRDEPAMGQYLGWQWLYTLARRQSWASDTGEVPRDRIVSLAEFKFRLGCLTLG